MKENFLVPRINSALRKAGSKKIKSNEKFQEFAEKKCRRCNKKICNGKSSRYIQPLREKNLKPLQKSHLSSEPLSKHTVYRKSYDGVSGEKMLKCRPKACKPSGEIAVTKEKMSHETIFKMSYLPNKCISRRKPIFPKIRACSSSEPFVGLTTHMHDYVPKMLMCRPAKILYEDNMKTAQDKFAEHTIHRLSYMVPVGAERVVSLKPKVEYRPPAEAMATQSIQRMSYLPVQLPPKEIFPWMKREKHSRVSAPMEKDSVYKMSYFPNPDFRPPKPIRPPQGGEAFHVGGKFNPHSIYNLSYGPQKIIRMPPIIPKAEIELVKQKFDGNTIHKMSYLPNLKDVRRQPMKPAQRKTSSEAPMEKTTTHMRDFVPRIAPKEASIKPKSSQMCLNENGGCFSEDTIHRLSFMPPDMDSFQPARSCKPFGKEFRSEAPFDGQTINKLSFQPPPKGFQGATPWVQKESSVKCSGKISGDTIHTLSYLPPGHIVTDDTCCSCEKPLLPCGQEGQDEYPTAGV